MDQEELFLQIKNAATKDLRELIEFKGPYFRKFGNEERQINLAGFVVTVNEKVFGYAKSELARAWRVIFGVARRQCSGAQYVQGYCHPRNGIR
jgi:hypothetical protein